MYGLLYDIKCSAARALERVIGRVTVKDKRANSHNYLDCRAHDLKFRTDSVRVMNQFGLTRTPSIAFRHLPPNSARTGYATAVHRRGQRPPKGLGISKTVEAT